MLDSYVHVVEDVCSCSCLTLTLCVNQGPHTCQYEVTKS